MRINFRATSTLSKCGLMTAAVTAPAAHALELADLPAMEVALGRLRHEPA
jgi:hypothetical protein